MAQLVSWGGQNNLKLGQLRLAQQYADAGMFARAKAAFEKAGGVWGNAVHRLLKKEADATSRYGGDIEFNWGNYGVRTQAQLNKIIAWAREGKFGRISNYINTLAAGSGGAYKTFNADSNRLQKKLAAEYLGKQDTSVAGRERTFKRDEPVDDKGKFVDPLLYKPDKSGETNWQDQFKGVITPGQTGAWSVDEGGQQARQDAQKWRNKHMDAAMNKYGLSRNAAGEIKRASNENITDTDWQSFLTQRNKVAKRFRKMIGHGEFA